MPFSILHISDLHRSPRDPISNDELVSALISDRDRYIRENPPVAAPEAIVVSGDIIQGVPLGTDDHSSKLAEQYATAAEFLEELVNRFLNGDKSRVIIVPGNHDIDWHTAFSALEPVERNSIPADIASLLYSEDSDYRWDWKSMTLYRVANREKYEQRLDPFWDFFDGFYSGVPGLLKVQRKSDANLFILCDGHIAVAGYNSCHGNDCFAVHGMIRKDVVARSHLELNDSGKVFDLRMAVWHHSIEGPPYRTDYMDVDIVRGMIGREFRLGLYGHQHKAQVTPHQIWLPDSERMAVVSAGSLCAGAGELPIGVHRQYNILEIGDDFKSVRVHVRAMAVANLFSRGQFIDLGGVSFVNLDWSPARNVMGAPIDTNVARVRIIIEKAEIAVKSGHPGQAVELLSSLDLSAGTYQRQLFLTAAIEAQEWQAVLATTEPPTTIEELIQRVEAFIRLREFDPARETLSRFAQHLQLPNSAEDELRRRIAAEEAIKR